jgi:hypothetical protein
MNTSAVKRKAETPPLNREELFELGRRAPYYRYVNFPVEGTALLRQLLSRQLDPRQLDPVTEVQAFTVPGCCRIPSSHVMGAVIHVPLGPPQLPGATVLGPTSVACAEEDDCQPDVIVEG